MTLNRFYLFHLPALAALLTVLLVMTAAPAWAHTLYMNLVDNEDGTLTVEAMFSTGATGAGLPLILEDGQGNPIKTYKIDENGECTFEIPDQPYSVFLNGGPGHTCREKGPAKL